MYLVVLFGLWVDVQVPQLGHDDFAVREAATVRLDNPLAALFLPAGSADPETNYRLRYLGARNRKWACPAYVERLVFRADRAEWVRLYLVTGRSAIAEQWDTFAALHDDPATASALFRAWPSAPGESIGFLFGPICPGEYERYRAHLDYHRARAPAPREPAPNPER